MKILNLYACIGGNRKLWGDEHDIVAVELDPKIAEIYQDHFPNDTVIVGDAHQYLLEHFNEYDFIWSSPPCPTHSRARFWGCDNDRIKPIYPDMKLYQEILFLKHYCKCDWVVENVVSYYKPLITPFKIASHYLWSSFYIHEYKTDIKREVNRGTKEHWKKITGFNLDSYKNIGRKDTIYRNCVDSDLGKHILDSATKNIQQSLF